MSPLATTLSEPEIDALANYYQDLPVR